MADRRYAHRYATPTLSADRDEEPRAACADRLDLVDAMHDHAADTKGHRAARSALSLLCQDCPLRSTCGHAVIHKVRALSVIGAQKSVPSNQQTGRHP